MNKEEEIKNSDTLTIDDKRTNNLIDMVIKSDVLAIVEQIDESQKPTVPQSALNFYNNYKGSIDSLEEWFSYVIEEEETEIELNNWLYNNDKKTNLQREFAFATLIVNGIDAVEVEQDKHYHVKLKLTEQELIYSEETGSFYFDYFSLKKEISNTFTKSELEKAGFGEVFDSPMFEVEEVTE